MKKTLRAFAAISALALLFGFASCQTGDEEPISQNTPVTPDEPSDDEKYSTKLVNFNGNNTVWNAEINGFCMDESDLGNIENYMVYNHKVDLENDTIVLKATVNFSTLSGHTGVGFISVDGLKRKGYQLLTGQNIKNVGCSEGGGGQGFDSKVEGFSWTLNKDYIFEVTLSQNTMSYVVKDETGELASKLNTTVYHNKNDIVYPAFGGTSRKSATYKNISVTLNGKEIAIDGIDPQSQLPTLSLDKTTVRINSTTTGTVVATATYEGNVVPVTVTSSDTNAVTVSVGEDGKTITVTPVAQTSGTTVTVKHSKADYISATFEVVVADFNETDSYGALKVYPANAETAAYEDSTLRLTFDEKPTLSAGGFVSIYDGDGTLVDTITMSEEKQNTLAGLTVKVKSQLVRVEDKNLLITPHFGKLESGKTYYVAIPQGVITGKLNGIEFTGLTNVATASSWKFTTRQAPTISSEITVNSAEDSTADFRSLNGALKAIGTSSTSEYTINLAKGTYYELINTKIAGTVKIVGETTNPDETVIKYINHNEWNGSTNIRPSFYVGGTGNLILKNVTIQNATRRGVDTNAQESQAEAIYFQSTGTLAAYNCNFKSYQDTIQVGNKGGKAWFYKCNIEGDVDFIWGTADVALFEECKLKALNDEARTTKTEDLLVARTYLTNGKIAKGFVVLNSEFEIVDGITAGFGRCAGSGDFYDQCAVVNTKVTGTLTDSWWTEKSYTPLAGHETHVGWKDYNITDANGTVLTPTSRCPNTSSMAETLYAKEYNGRRAILNRVYNTDESKYEAVNALKEWDISILESEFGATSDESLNNDYGEATSLNLEYSLVGGEGVLADNEVVQSTTKVIDAVLTLDATTGKFQEHQPQYGTCLNAESKFSLTLDKPTLIILEVTYDGNGDIQLDEETAVDGTVGTKYFFASEGTHVLNIVGGQSYIKSLKIIK